MNKKKEVKGKANFHKGHRRVTFWLKENSNKLENGRRKEKRGREKGIKKA